MKIKLLSVLLIFVMLAAFMAGCGEDPAEENPTTPDTTVSDTQSDAETPDDTSSTTSDSAIDEKIKNDFNARVDAALDLSIYKDPEYSGSSIYYYLLSGKKPDYSWEGTIKLPDNTEFILPVSYSKLAAKGWTMNDTYANQEIDPNKQTLTPIAVKNSDGYSFDISVANLTDKKLALSDCNVYSITLESDNIIYTVCGSITKDSSFEKVVSTLGAPGLIRCSVYNGKIDSIYVEYTTLKYSTIRFEFTADGKSIESVDFSASY